MKVSIVAISVAGVFTGVTSIMGIDCNGLCRERVIISVASVRGSVIYFRNKCF